MIDKVKKNIVDVSIVLATYNEEKSIKEELERIKKAMDSSKYSYEVIVVDDGSKDKTPDIVEKNFPWIKLFRRPVNYGTGTARKFGTEKAKGKYVVWSDADLTYPNYLIPELIPHLDKYDQVIGARKTEEGKNKLLRVPTKWFIRKLAIFLSGKNIPDLNSGLRAFKRGEGLKYLYLLPPGFSCVATITLAFLINGHPVKFVPIDYFKRVGKSKFHPIKDTWEYFLQVIRMIMFFNPLKIFLPISIFLMIIGIGKFVYDIIFQHFSIKGSTIVALMVAIQVFVFGLLAELIVKMSKK
ncbi:Dodecaprenyl-phosphate galacturonate synthase [subsurface metagenome]